MKRAFTLLVILFTFFSLVGCGGTTIEKPNDTNLEFWITERVDNVDFSSYQMKYGWMGADEYYGNGYEPTTNGDDEQLDPKYCVKYLVTNYPDYSSKHKAITQITITDPSIVFYGLSLKSTIEKITEIMEELKYKVEVTDKKVKAIKGNVTFSFTEESITIRADVTNGFGIQY